MKIEQSKVVSLSYQLESDGDIIETVTADKPMQFIYGAGYLLPKFEEKIAGKVVGDTFDFVLAADEAYGDYDDEAVIDLPKEMFEIEGTFDEEAIVEGAQIPMQDNDGNRLTGIVESVDDTTVRMDFNHPLAGCDLHFTGAVVALRDVSPEDFANKCGCACNDCSDDSQSNSCGCETCGQD